MATFNFTYAPGTTLQQMIGFEMAGRIWDAHLNDPITVNIHVGVSSSLPGNSIGGALPGIRATQNYTDVVRGLSNDITSLEDWIAAPYLQTKSEYEAWFDAFDPKNGSNNGKTVKTRTLNITRANAKALNLISSSTELDGVILFGGLQGSSFRWSYDFTRSTAAPASTLDFLSTALHEIGHVLGFISGVDKPGWLSSVTADKAASEEYKKSLEERISYTTPLDLFRYSILGTGRNDLSYGSRGGGKFFSLDGKIPLAEFATGADQSLAGDGFQASHWKNANTRTGIMAPAIHPEERSWMTDTDLRALDVIGWNIQWRPSINLSTLKSQAEATLAQRIGVTATWLSQNATLAEQRLVRDRSADIDRMIQNSQVYPWATRPPGATPWRQVLDLLEQQVAYSNFETLDEGFAVQFETGSQTSSAFPNRVSRGTPWRNEAQLGSFRGSRASFPIDLSTFTPRTREIAQFRQIAPAELQRWFDQLEKSIRRSPSNSMGTTEEEGQRSRKFTDFWDSVNWTDL